MVGTIGPTGVAAHPEPYVFLGVRISADPNGYLDPLGFLPPRTGATRARAPAGACARGRATACELARPEAVVRAAGAPPSLKQRPLRRPRPRRPRPEPAAAEAPADAPAPEPAEGPAGADPEPVGAGPSGVTLAARPQPRDRHVPPDAPLATIAVHQGSPTIRPRARTRPARAGARARRRPRTLSRRLRPPPRVRIAAVREATHPPTRGPRPLGCPCGHRSPSLGRRVTGGRPSGPRLRRPRPRMVAPWVLVWAALVGSRCRPGAGRRRPPAPPAGPRRQGPA